MSSSRMSDLAVNRSLIFAMLALLLVLIAVLAGQRFTGFLTSTVAIIYGHIALNQIRLGQVRRTATNKALAALVMGYTALGVASLNFLWSFFR